MTLHRKLAAKVPQPSCSDTGSTKLDRVILAEKQAIYPKTVHLKGTAETFSVPPPAPDLDLGRSPVLELPRVQYHPLGEEALIMPETACLPEATAGPETRGHLGVEDSTNFVAQTVML